MNMVFALEDDLVKIEHLKKFFPSLISTGSIYDIINILARSREYLEIFFFSCDQDSEQKLSHWIQNNRPKIDIIVTYSESGICRSIKNIFESNGYMVQIGYFWDIDMGKFY